MFFTCVLLLLLSFSCFAEDVESEQTSFESLGCQILPAGGRTHFACPFQNYFNYSYQMKWRKTFENNSLTSLTTDEFLVINDDRFKVSRLSSARLPGDWDFYELRIKDLRKSDAGVYYCEIKLSNTTKLECSIELMVNGTPAMIRNSLYSYVNMAVMVFIVGVMRSKN